MPDSLITIRSIAGIPPAYVIPPSPGYSVLFIQYQDRLLHPQFQSNLVAVMLTQLPLLAQSGRSESLASEAVSVFRIAAALLLP